MSDHHAFLYIDQSVSLKVLPTEIQTQSADIQHVSVDTFSVSDARTLRESASVRPAVAEKRLFVVFTQSMTHEAQNALLKLFEDPPVTAEFHVVMPSLQALLPTLQSRFLIISSIVVPNQAIEVFSEFLDQSYADRLTTITTKTKAKDVVWIQLILQGAYDWLQTNSSAHEARKSVALVDQFVMRRGASKKMLLEELALSLPNR